jgi:hypothetical protein
MVQHGDTQNKNLFLVQHGDTQNKNQVCLFSWYNMGIHKIKIKFIYCLGTTWGSDHKIKIKFVYFFGTTWGYTK